MSLKESLDGILRHIPEGELVFIRPRDHGFGEVYEDNEPRNFLLRWGGFQDGKFDGYSKDGSEAHLCSVGEILRLDHLTESWGNMPVQLPLTPPDERGKAYFCLYSIPEELAIGKVSILNALDKYQLQSHKPFVEQLH